MRFARLRHIPFLSTVLVVGAACSSGSEPVVPANLTTAEANIVLTEIGDTATITAILRDQNGERITDAQVTYASANESVATVSSLGVVTAVGEGSVIVTVRSGDLTASVAVFVEIPPQFTIRKSVQSWFGGTADNPSNPPLSGFEFLIRGAAGSTRTVTTDASGTARATLDPGSYSITESNDLGLTDFTRSANIEISSGVPFDLNWVNRQLAATNTPKAIINASPLSVPAGDNDQTEVRLWAGNSVDPNGDSLTYSWDAPGGTFIGSATSTDARLTFPGGTANTITLTVDDGNGNQDIDQVQISGAAPLPAAGNFNIELIPIEPIDNAGAQAAFDLAEATWESIIRNDLPDIAVNLSADQVSNCYDNAEAINETIDDVRIYIEFSNIDGPGNTLASAGPCFIRVPQGGNATPIFGVMRFDSSDFGNQPSSTLNQIILHEMAHVLGFGTLWRRNELIVNPSCPDTNGDGPGDCLASDPPGPDTRFVGPGGSGAYQALGGLLGADVPVENGEGIAAGPGSRDGHWREAIFGTELMTPRIQGGESNALSLLTIASLADMGYVVDFAQAENYGIPGQSPFPGGAVILLDSEGVDLSDDIRSGPIYEIGQDGGVREIAGGG